MKKKYTLPTFFKYNIIKMKISHSIKQSPAGNSYLRVVVISPDSTKTLDQAFHHRHHHHQHHHHQYLHHELSSKLSLTMVLKDNDCRHWKGWEVCVPLQGFAPHIFPVSNLIFFQLTISHFFQLPISNFSRLKSHIFSALTSHFFSFCRSHIFHLLISNFWNAYSNFLLLLM